MSNNCNSNVSKAQALGLASYLTFNTNYHFTLSVTESTCMVSIFFESKCEQISLEYEIRKFLADGCSTEDKYLKDCNCYTYTIEYPCVFSKGY